LDTLTKCVCTVVIVICTVLCSQLYLKIKAVNIPSYIKIQQKEISQFLCYDMTDVYIRCRDYARVYTNSTTEDAWNNAIKEWVDFDEYKRVDLYNSTLLFAKKVCDNAVTSVRVGLPTRERLEFQKECIKIFGRI